MKVCYELNTKKTTVKKFLNMKTLRSRRKKSRKSRQTLKADDLLEIARGSTERNRDLGSREQRTCHRAPTTTRMKIEQKDDDLEKVLSKARRVKQ
jgi:hypothetical protein